MSTLFETIVERDKSFICNTYGRYPLAISRGKGCRLYDLEDNEYIDLLSGIAVCNLGHARDDIADVMADQARKMVHVSNLFYQNEQIDLAERLLSTCDADKVFFSNSGAEANEGAIKLARRYMRTVCKREAYEIITVESSFHGRTLATLTATGQTGPIKDGFAPLPEGFVTVPFNDIAALREVVSDKTAAIMIEMVQGEGGVRPMPEQYVQDICALCKEKDVLLIVDEVQTGLCRTGRFWAHQHYGIKPDIFTTAKALANGLPMGAVFATDSIACGFAPGSHATTFGGGALLSVVASKVVDIMKQERLAERAAEVGEWFVGEAQKLAEKHPGKIANVRGLGLMVGIELNFDGSQVWRSLLERRFILNLTKGKILRLLPPLVISREDLAGFLQALDEVLEGVEA